MKKIKKRIPSALRAKVWRNHFPIYLNGECLVCSRLISYDNFECGHIVAESMGGKTVESNLRPICTSCNRSMGKCNLNKFNDMFDLKKEKDWTVVSYKPTLLAGRSNEDKPTLLAGRSNEDKPTKEVSRKPEGVKDETNRKKPKSGEKNIFTSNYKIVMFYNWLVSFWNRS